MNISKYKFLETTLRLNFLQKFFVLLSLSLNLFILLKTSARKRMVRADMVASIRCKCNRFISLTGSKHQKNLGNANDPRILLS